MAGAVEMGQAVESGVPRDRILTLPDPATGLAAVQSGRADAFALTSLAIGRLVEAAGPGAGVERSEPFSMIAGEETKGHGGFGFRPDDEDLRDAFNAELAEFIRKNDYQFSAEGFGKEGDSWLRAIGMIAGSRKAK